MKILIVGGGNMGRTYAESFVSNHSVARRDLCILERAEEKIPYFLNMGFECVESNPGPYISEMNLVVFAVKPQDTKELFQKIGHFMKEDQLQKMNYFFYIHSDMIFRILHK